MRYHPPWWVPFYFTHMNVVNNCKGLIREKTQKLIVRYGREYLRGPRPGQPPGQEAAVFYYHPGEDSNALACSNVSSKSCDSDSPSCPRLTGLWPTLALGWRHRPSACRSPPRCQSLGPCPSNARKSINKHDWFRGDQRLPIRNDKYQFSGEKIRLKYGCIRVLGTSAHAHPYPPCVLGEAQEQQAVTVTVEEPIGAL